VPLDDCERRGTNADGGSHAFGNEPVREHIVDVRRNNARNARVSTEAITTPAPHASAARMNASASSCRTMRQPLAPSVLITSSSLRCEATFAANSPLALMHVSNRRRTASAVTERSEGA
jgi:hypothetical protein